MAGALCGLWVDAAGRVLCTYETPGGGREERVAEFRPFAWLRAKPVTASAGITIDELSGEGPFRFLAHGESLEVFEEFASTSREETG
ncbi:MAG: hypothetical protein RLZZ221_3081, partial [Verrucomicrobiota bacterium]